MKSLLSLGKLKAGAYKAVWEVPFMINLGTLFKEQELYHD